jgi:hypothetical protein
MDLGGRAKQEARAELLPRTLRAQRMYYLISSFAAFVVNLFFLVPLVLRATVKQLTLYLCGLRVLCGEWFLCALNWLSLSCYQENID